MISCSEAGLLPAKLDDEGMDRALAALQRALRTPAVPNAPTTGSEPRAVEAAEAAVKKPPLSKDPRCVALSDALKPVLAGTCPQGAGGYGGALQANLHPEDAEALGGVALIRAAMRRAARQLGWRVQTLGNVGERVVLVLVHDVREVPAPFEQALDEDRRRRGAEMSERVAALMDGKDPAALGPGPVDLQTRAFLEAARSALAAQPAAWS